jgi:peptide deformylase
LSELPEHPETLEIIHFPHPGLREVAEPIEDPADPKLAALVARMRELMLTHGGIGLAATQVNVTARVFLANPTREPANELVVINPRLIEEEGWQETEEGCLSIPQVTCKLRRRQRVRIQYQGLDGQTRVADARDLLATVIQHETDHLNGRLIIDRVGPLGKLAIRDQLKDLERAFEKAGSPAGK